MVFCYPAFTSESFLLRASRRHEISSVLHCLLALIRSPCANMVGLSVSAAARDCILIGPFQLSFGTWNNWALPDQEFFPVMAVVGNTVVVTLRRWFGTILIKLLFVHGNRHCTKRRVTSEGGLLGVIFTASSLASVSFSDIYIQLRCGCFSLLRARSASLRDDGWSLWFSRGTDVSCDVRSRKVL